MTEIFWIPSVVLFQSFSFPFSEQYFFGLITDVDTVDGGNFCVCNPRTSYRNNIHLKDRLMSCLQYQSCAKMRWWIARWVCPARTNNSPTSYPCSIATIQCLVSLLRVKLIFPRRHTHECKGKNDDGGGLFFGNQKNYTSMILFAKFYFLKYIRNRIKFRDFWNFWNLENSTVFIANFFILGVEISRL